MAIPALENSYGHRVLPEGVYTCTADEFHRAFVLGFPASRTRSIIWLGLNDLLIELAALRIECTLWINGSFATGKANPADVDVVAFIRAKRLNGLSTKGTEFLMSLTNAAWSKRRYQTHLFIVPVFDASDPRRVLYERLRCYWRKWWGQSRAGDRKGFLSMTVGRASKAPTVAVNRCSKASHVRKARK
jgi:hypothetical protein